MPDSQNDLDFGRYRIQRLLGHGGMGEVYLARDEDLERDVAIKFVTAARVQDSQARARLLREAQAAARLDHPAICPVHEAGVTPDGRAYIVMPYVAGTPLSDLLAQGTLAVRDALKICEQIADALSAAHHLGIVHRDLKPGNIIVAPNGRPRLLDFGLAQSPIVPRVIAEATTITIGPEAPAPLVGTPSYMSPEQVQQRPLDGRSDLFSLGAVLYECLTGVRAFDGTSPYDVMNRVLRVDPPQPSTLRKELTDRHDALCARLLAKEPADRFASADEAVGAFRLLLPDTGRFTDSSGGLPPPPPRPWTWKSVAGVSAAAILAGGVIWYWTRGQGLPTVPEDSDRWYRRGVEAIRDGSYQSGRTALEQAVVHFPQHALAYARLAEADMELDDQRAAQDDLLRLSSIVPNESHLPTDEQLRVRAVRALVLRDVDGAVNAYKELVRANPGDAGALVDLGRAQDAAGRIDDARVSYQQAIAKDPQYSTAYLQLGEVESVAMHLDKALTAFSEAERLYKAESNVEGQAEVLLLRGGALDAAGQEKDARTNLEQARAMAQASQSKAQEVRAALSLSSVTASEGSFADAERIAGAAVDEAIANGLETTAARGLLDLAATLIDQHNFDAAGTQVHRAIRIADERSATETALRGRIELAEVLRQQGQRTEALALIGQVLPRVSGGRYRRFELNALQVALRAHQQLGEIDEAFTIAQTLMATAEQVNDQGRIALVASELASVMTDAGQYPRALALRERAEDILRRQGDNRRLPYTLANHADLLIRLGRADEASRPLDELDAGIKAGLDSYVGRARRVAALRAFAAATRLDCTDASKYALRAEPDPKPEDSASLLALGISAYCTARLRRLPEASPVAKPTAEQVLVADRQYWLAAAALVRNDPTEALGEAETGLKAAEGLHNDELLWRLATVAFAAARGVKDQTLAGTMSSTAADAVGRLRTSWRDDLTSYLSRPDLRDLETRAAR